MFNFETWAKEFFAQPVVPMNEQISAMFFNMTVMENQNRKLNIPEIQN